MIHGNKQGDVRRCAFIIHAIWEGDVTTVRGIQLGLRLYWLRMKLATNEKTRQPKKYEMSQSFMHVEISKASKGYLVVRKVEANPSELRIGW